MGFVLFGLFVTILLVAAAIVLAHDEELGKAIVFGALALFVLLVLVFIVAPGELGYSQVPPRAEEFTKRLEVGVVYEVIGIKHIPGGDEVILFVWAPLNGYRAIRVKTSDPIPVRFTLINGQPVEVK